VIAPDTVGFSLDADHADETDCADLTTKNPAFLLLFPCNPHQENVPLSMASDVR
jgi:hypothetical protein